MKSRSEDPDLLGRENHLLGIVGQDALRTEPKKDSVKRYRDHFPILVSLLIR